MMLQATSKAQSSEKHQTQRTQYPLIKEYALNYRSLNIIYDLRWFSGDLLFGGRPGWLLARASVTGGEVESVGFRVS